MRREWTDPRDGREWTVTRVGGVGTPNTGELESIGEEELGELLDAAREAA